MQAFFSRDKIRNLFLDCRKYFALIFKPVFLKTTYFLDAAKQLWPPFKALYFSVSLIVENYRLNACTGHFERNQSDFWLQKIFMWLKNRMFWRRNPMFWWDSLNIHVRLVTKVSPKWSNIAYETEKISFT